jgi:hypothetical protein
MKEKNGLKECTSCKLLKAYKHFYKNSQKKGYQNQCKSCMKDRYSKKVVDEGLYDSNESRKFYNSGYPINLR